MLSCGQHLVLVWQHKQLVGEDYGIKGISFLWGDPVSREPLMRKQGMHENTSGLSTKTSASKGEGWRYGLLVVSTIHWLHSALRTWCP